MIMDGIIPYAKLKALEDTLPVMTANGYYGVSDTAAGTAAKTVTIEGFTTLEAGVKVTVKFTAGNTAASPTLNVSGTGAAAITVYGTTAAASGAWNAGSVVDFVYDGTRWIIAGVSAVDATLTASGVAADAAAVGVLKSALNEVADIPSLSAIDLTQVTYEQGYLDTGGVFVATTGANSQKTTDAIPLQPGNYKVYFNGVNGTTPVLYVRAIAVYNEDDECTSYTKVSGLTDFSVGESDAYVRINTQYTEVTKYTIVPDEQTSILDDVIVPTDTTLSLESKPANAKATGDAILDLRYSGQTTPYRLDLTGVDFERGYLDTGGVFVPTGTSNAQKTTVPIKLPKGRYTCYFRGLTDQAIAVNQARALAVYEGSTCVYYHLYAPGDDSLTFTIYNDTQTVRINANYSTVYEYAVVREQRIHNYVHARRPMIAFVFDGDYNMNDDFADLFVEHGVRCGFAPQYDTAFSHNTLAQYKAWENNGFEILAHSSQAVGTQSAATDDEIAEIVRDSCETFAGYGFDLHGFVAYQGNTKPVAVETAKLYYDYGFTQPNHSGSYTESHPNLVNPDLQFSVDGPYELWRYSMQSSTLAQMKAAVDLCASEKCLIVFYGHANSGYLDNMTLENVGELLDYIYAKGIRVYTPYEAIKDYYSIRYGDFTIPS